MVKGVVKPKGRVKGQMDGQKGCKRGGQRGGQKGGYFTKPSLCHAYKLGINVSYLINNCRVIR